MKVLVVDDSMVIRQLATLALLTTADWRVVTAGSGTQALRLASSESPEVILLDVMMPGIDGPATLAELRSAADTSDIPVIFVTAENDPSGGRRASPSLGAAGVISKPFELDRLAGQVTGILEQAA